MYTIEKGVLPDSNIIFHTPSPLAKSMFFYPISMGRFICDHNYKVARNHYQSYLLLYVLKGSGEVIYEETSYTLTEGDILFLNCYKKHTYFTSSWEIAWMHFDGNVSAEYYKLILDRFQSSISIKGSPTIKNLLLNCLTYFDTTYPINEPFISCQINQLLCELYNLSAESENISALTPVDEAIHYMKFHFKEDITLNTLAQKVSLSPYYFTRLFKKETGCTPYEYLMSLRINESKYLLKNTNKLIKEIAFDVGFNSESNFMSYFKKATGYTPSTFRNLPL